MLCSCIGLDLSSFDILKDPHRKLGSFFKRFDETVTKVESNLRKVQPQELVDVIIGSVDDVRREEVFVQLSQV